jgi:hypothetical protein
MPGGKTIHRTSCLPLALILALLTCCSSTPGFEQQEEVTGASGTITLDGEPLELRPVFEWRSLRTPVIDDEGFSFGFAGVSLDCASTSWSSKGATVPLADLSCNVTFLSPYDDNNDADGSAMETGTAGPSKTIEGAQRPYLARIGFPLQDGTLTSRPHLDEKGNGTLDLELHVTNVERDGLRIEDLRLNGTVVFGDVANACGPMLQIP